MTGYCKLEDKLEAGEIETTVLNLEGAMKCIGQVHTSTWLNRLGDEEKKKMMSMFR